MAYHHLLLFQPHFATALPLFDESMEAAACDDDNDDQRRLTVTTLCDSRPEPEREMIWWQGITQPTMTGLRA